MSKRKRDEQITNEKAKKILLDYAIEGCGYCHQGGEEIEISFKMAAEALEKQIPMKVNYADGITFCECGNIVKSYERYCSECGQKLDWGKNDEN